MADLMALLNEMRQNAYFTTIARNPLAQFGQRNRQYLGASLLPERTVEGNAYREDQIKYRTVIANAGTRYSPTQLKDGDLVGDFLVELADTDIKRTMSGRQYDALIKLLMQNQSIDGMAQITNWVDTTVNLALAEALEKQRWEAIVDASVVLEGDDGFKETLNYSNPTGHRVNAGSTWSTDTNDPFDDIVAGADKLSALGYTVNRIITSTNVVSIMAGNDKVKSRVGLSVVNASGQIQGAVGRATRDAINGALQADGLPTIETYDLQYRKSSGTGRFLKNDVFVMIATTGQDEAIDQGDTEQLVTDTLGYTAIGRAAGQSDPGRYIRVASFEDKPPRLEAEGWQTALPVVLEPEAIYVIKSIS